MGPRQVQETGMGAFEFFLNNFHWIQRIQWIKTKSWCSMVTRATPQLMIDTFLNVVVKKIFPLLSLGWYLFTVVSHNVYLTRSSNGNLHSTTMNGNVSVASWVLPLVTMPFLDFVMFHWIHWIQWNSFRKNSNGFWCAEQKCSHWSNSWIHCWRLIRVTLVVGLVFLPLNFGPVVGTYEGLLLFCECTWGGDSTWRLWRTPQHYTS